jgi:hypothetical protein
MGVSKPTAPRALAPDTVSDPLEPEVLMKFDRTAFRRLVPALATVLALASGQVLADPPGRVARISYLAGDVSFAPAGEDSWYGARINRPMVTGDRLWAGPGGRVEMELGTAMIRLDSGSSFQVLTLDDSLAQVQLTEGVLNLRIGELWEGQVYEVDTPTLAFVATQPGEYRIDIAPRGDSTQVTVFDGYADVYGEDGRRVAVQAGTSTRFFDPALRDYQRLAMPRPDDFDRWAFARNDRYQNSVARRYVAPGMIGYSDLDDYGSWRPVADYGHVWFPRRVAAGWAPYRDGRWSWIDPWGWTWVDDTPWGFAPSHYGRWVYVANGWGWVPGPRHVRPIYAPALVAFVGGSNWSVGIGGGSPIGWFPLGPRDVYVPWYRVSRGYFGRVNVHNTVVINNTYVTNVYNDFYVQGRPMRRDYTFRGAANAVTVVPRDSFVSARSAAESMARLRPGMLEQGELMTSAPAAPIRASLGDERARTSAPATRSFEREIVARTKPAQVAAPFEVRQRAIARNGGEPLAVEQLERMGAAQDSGDRSRVRMVGGERGGAPSVTEKPAARERSARGAVLGEVDAQPAPVVADPRARSAQPDRSAGSIERGRGREVVQPQAEPVPGALPSTRFVPGRDGRGAPASRSAPAPDAGIPLPQQRGRSQSAPAAEQGIPLPPRGRSQPRQAEPMPAPPPSFERSQRSRTSQDRGAAPEPQAQPWSAPSQRGAPAPAARQYQAPAPQRSMPEAMPQQRGRGQPAPYVAPAPEPAPSRAPAEDSDKAAARERDRGDAPTTGRSRDRSGR